MIRVKEQCHFDSFLYVSWRTMSMNWFEKSSCIYWVKADFTSIGKSGARVQLPVTTLAKQRKYDFFHG